MVPRLMKPTSRKKPLKHEQKLETDPLQTERADGFWLNYKWEFMRRSPEYKKAYKELQKSLASPSLSEIQKRYLVCGYRYRFGFYWAGGAMPDPEKTFEKAFADENLNLNACFSSAYSCSFENGIMSFSIDLRSVASIHEIKKLIARDINECERVLQKAAGQKRKGKRETDLSVILMAGDLRHQRKRKPYREIAKAMFPNDFNDNNINANPESAIRKVAQYCEKYQELINGGYKRLVGP
jgi:hypothetical protein